MWEATLPIKGTVDAHASGPVLTTRRVQVALIDTGLIFPTGSENVNDLVVARMCYVRGIIYNHLLCRRGQAKYSRSVRFGAYG